MYGIAADRAPFISVFVYVPLMCFVLHRIASFTRQSMLLGIAPVSICVNKEVFFITGLMADFALAVHPLMLLIPDAITDRTPAARPHMIGILYGTTSFTLAMIPPVPNDSANDRLIQGVRLLSASWLIYFPESDEFPIQALKRKQKACRAGQDQNPHTTPRDDHQS